MMQQRGAAHEAAGKAGNGGHAESTAVLRMELQHPRNDGSVADSEVCATLVFDGEGRLIGIHGVTRDIGERKNVHPHNKQDVGDRLARLARANVYGQKIEFSGPVYEAMKIEGQAIRVNFSHADGLVARDGTLKWFSLAGADGKFVSADAQIDGQSVIVSSPGISAPVAVRSAWVNFPEGGHLYNAAGLPAAQFRTDAPKFELQD